MAGLPRFSASPSLSSTQQGFVYIVSLLLVMLLTMSSASVLVRSVSEAGQTERFDSQMVALHLAEAGVDQAARNLGTPTTTSDDVTSLNLPTGTFTVDPPVPLGSQRWRVTAHGTSPSDQGNPRHVEAILQLTPQSVFQYPLFGKNTVDLKKGSLTDSYNSSLGSYDPATAGQQGHVATNSTAAQSIRLRAGTAVNGQVIVGPGMATPSGAVELDTSVLITGTPSIVSAPQAMELPAIDLSGLTCGGDLNLPKNGTFTFAEANSPYCYTRINADQGSVITVSGDVVIYTSEVDFDKNLNVNATGRPTQLLLQIYGTSDVVIDKEGTFVGAIYAPEARARLKKVAEFYGALVAKDVEIDKESKFHYDESLQTVGPAGSYQVSVISWREP